jgi:hypothetical protein
MCAEPGAVSPAVRLLTITLSGVSDMADQSVDEIWRLIQAHPDYEVSNMGRVRRITEITYPMPNGGTATKAAGQLLKIGSFQSGRDQLPYARVGLQVKGQRSGKTLSLHRLVAQAFVPNPANKPCVNHLNYDVSDARAVNLEWATHKENALHSYRAGRWEHFPPKRCGVERPDAKLTNDDVRKIREMSASGLSNAKVAKVFSIDRSIVSRIRTGEAWKHVV